LVNLGVKAYSAVRDNRVHLHQLDRASGKRIRNQKVAGPGGPPVAKGDITLGYEVTPGRYVAVDPDETAALRPRSTRTVDITAFVELAAIDPIYYERTYWLAPVGDGAEQAYQLLLAAMEDEGRVGIGSVVMRNTQHLAAIRPYEDALAMSTMRFADAVVARSEVDVLPERRSPPDERQLDLARQILTALADDWAPERYQDTYTASLRDLFEQRAKGATIAVEDEAEQSATVHDLLEALEKSAKLAAGA
jgi:DNA end-binding protein Ku